MDPYITEEDADAYFAERLCTSAWDTEASSDGNRNAALVQATRAIDRLNFAGSKTSATQEREFPRNSGTTIPTDIQYACAEVALALLDGIEPDKEIENLALVAQGISGARSTYDRSFALEYLRNGIPTATAWAYLTPYLRDSNNLTLSRV